ncbi:hypothetical protein BC936DRAFT_144983 [Jimgerdemannia flammicorona]|uniref:Uncharacterized protein n=2 Tax=Jimgerdemannia flammicorona TaxID=994334 RepID=A0A433QFW2_9FUNG|nr:hypothetical protein BC936DRAFT_144983 [Jimgerdemannia flammicorona]RUS28644.1 hypothetical protein BC938DRAFT_481640 [Jimgerdemannia flammicorona]
MDVECFGCSDPPLAAGSYATIITAWFPIAFGILSVSIIGRKAFSNYNRLRGSCFVMSVVTVVLCVANVLRISSTIHSPEFAILRGLCILLYTDLMVAITLNLGRKFYIRDGCVNNLYILTIAATVLFNIIHILGTTLSFIGIIDGPAGVFSTVARVSWPVVLLFAYLYAFFPVIGAKTGEDNIPSAVVAVGVWYLVGMSFILLLETIVMVIPLADGPWQINKDLDIRTVAISAFLRLALLDFYCFPLPNVVITAIISKFFPNSPATAIDCANRRSAPNVAFDRFEMHLGLAIKLTDEEQVSVTSKTYINSGNRGSL